MNISSFDCRLLLRIIFEHFSASSFIRCLDFKFSESTDNATLRLHLLWILNWWLVGIWYSVQSKEHRWNIIILSSISVRSLWILLCRTNFVHTIQYTSKTSLTSAKHYFNIGRVNDEGRRKFIQWVQWREYVFRRYKMTMVVNGTFWA